MRADTLLSAGVPVRTGVSVRGGFEPRQAMLRRFTRLRTSDVEELSEAISYARSHRIEVLPGATGRSSELSYVPFSRSSIGYLAVNGAFRDRIGPTESAFCLLITLEGSGEHSVGPRQFPLNRVNAAIHSAGHAAEVTTSGHSEILSLSIGKAAIVSELENQLGRPIRAPIEFAPSLSMTSAAGAKLHNLSVRLCHTLDRPSERHLLNVEQMERWMVSHVVGSLRHNYTRLLNRASSAAPWQVRAAEEFIRANAAKALSLGDIASVAGVSVRALQYSFQQHRGMRPMYFLRQVRLEHVHGELLSAGTPTTVSEAAMRWGFSHFGRFAADYAKRYGEAPSATLRRNRARRKQPS